MLRKLSDYRAARTAWHKAAAWSVVGWLLLTGKVPFEAEALSERWKAYDNDVSISGDRGVLIKFSAPRAE